MKKQIIKNAVNNIKEFGYNDVNESNIFTDFLYREIFYRMLKDNLGENSDVDFILNDLILELGK